MQEFDYRRQYMKKKQNVIVDALSRRYSQLHRQSTNIVKRVLSVTTISVNNPALQS